jgi:serine/threonine protein kinase
MSLCINPHCRKPDDPDNTRNRFCENCGSDLLLHGRYRVTRLLSDKSGFGIIYESDEQGTPEILKVLKENLNSDAKAVELFKQEAEVLGQLSHSGIPKVDGYFPYQTRNGPSLHCIVMEKIEGSNLEEWMEARGNRPITEPDAIAWLKQLALILKLVHDKHYLHRDIKPSNIMLRTPPYQGRSFSEEAGGGQLVLIDFGTAREVTRTYLAKLGSGQGITAIVSSGYTPPEQANGEARVQSDFFALGRTFVFLLTGQYPNTMYDARLDQLNWRSHTSGISPGLLNLVDWLMMRDPNQRPANAQAILDRLAELERQPGLSAVETVNVVGAPRTQQLPPPQTATLPAQHNQRDQWPFFAFWAFLLDKMGLTDTQQQPAQHNQRDKLYPLAFLAVILLLGLIGLAALAFFDSDSPSRRSWPKNAQIPQEKGEVDYFPYVEGTDSQGRTAEFNVAVLSREYKWQFGSSYQVKHNDRLLPLDTLKSDLESEGIQRIMENPSQIIAVGTASCEGSSTQEERRAFERAKQIQLLGKKLFSQVPSVQNYRLLNLGQFRGDNCNSNQDETSYQRSVIIIGVKQETPGVVLDEALRSRLEKKPFGDFQIQEYSLGSPDKFKTIPSRLE